jgi:hypothetical protein
MKYFTGIDVSLIEKRDPHTNQTCLQPTREFRPLIATPDTNPGVPTLDSNARLERRKFEIDESGQESQLGSGRIAEPAHS